MTSLIAAVLFAVHPIHTEAVSMQTATGRIGKKQFCEIAKGLFSNI